MDEGYALVDAFGLRRDATNWDYDLSQNTLATLKNYTDRGFTGQEQLDNLTLVDMNGRVYDPTVGRMVSADPTVPDALFSQAFNRFAYVYDSPLEYTDPSGFVALVPCSGTASEDSEPGVTPLGKICVNRYILLPAGFLSFLFPGWGNGSYLPWLPNPLLPGGGGPGSHGSAKESMNATQPQQPTPQQQRSTCNSALATAGQNESAVQRAMDDWPTLSLAGDLNNVNPAFLAAIGVRESGFRDINEIGGGNGVGVFQLTVSPTSGVTAAEANNLMFSSFYAAQMLNENRIFLGNKFPNFTGPQLFQATAASYNLGVGQISGNPNTINVGTSPAPNGHYGSNVVGITACFPQ